MPIGTANANLHLVFQLSHSSFSAVNFHAMQSSGKYKVSLNLQTYAFVFYWLSDTEYKPQSSPVPGGTFNLNNVAEQTV